MVGKLNILWWVVFAVGVVLGKLRQFQFDISQSTIAPDGFSHESIVINNAFPGPNLYGTMGDELEVTVNNLLNKPISIHWHGLTQKGSPGMDGVPYITQLPIQPQSQFVYRFKVGKQMGTYWYHAHTGLDGEQVFGALIIKELQSITRSLVEYNPKYSYQKATTIILSEWWHKNPDSVVAGLTSPRWRWIGEPNSILNNGRTYTAGNKKTSRLPFDTGYPVIKVQPGTTYRLRLIGANGLSYLKFSIPNHKLTLFEADGTILEPIEVDYINIYGGERYSVLVKFDQKVDNYYAHTQLTNRENDQVTNGFTIFQYEGAPSPDKLKQSPVPSNKRSEAGRYTRYMEDKVITSNWYRVKSKNLPVHYYGVPMNITKHIIIDSASARDNTLGSVMTINGRVHQTRTSGITLDKALSKQHTVDEVGEGVYDIRQGDHVQLVIQQWATKGQYCAPHPWHLHGHSFHIVGHGPDAFQPTLHTQLINKKLPTSPYLPKFRDTFSHFTNSIPRKNNGLIHDDAIFLSRYNLWGNQRGPEDTKLARQQRENTKLQGKVPCGWYALRFIADNPGSWLMHCHVTPHMIMGKQFVINELPR